MLGDIAINLNSLKEPRGFIKIVQTVLSMLVFSLYVSSTFEVEYTLTCAATGSKPADTQTKQIKLVYPFEYKENGNKLTFNKCSDSNPTANGIFVLELKSHSLSQFHVFMGVVPFIYGVACIIYFLLFELDITQPGADRHQVLFYTADIGFSCFTLFFGSIACFCAMSVSVNLGNYAKAGTFKEKLKDLCTATNTCSVKSHFNHSNIIGSIMFQIANMGVFFFSLYMMWKDQAWKSVTTMPYDNEPANTTSGTAPGATTQAYSAAYGNDYEYTYSN